MTETRMAGVLGFILSCRRFQGVCLGLPISLVFGLMLSFPAQAKKWTATVQQSTVKEDRIQGLKIRSKKLKVRFGRSGKRLIPIVVLSGAYVRPEWNLFYRNKSIVKSSEAKKAFKVKVKLRGKRTVVKMFTVGPTGVLTRGQFTIIFDQAEKFAALMNRRQKGRKTASVETKTEAEAATPSSRYFFMASLGPSMINYTEEDFANISFISLTAKFAGGYRLSKNWDLAGNIFGTALNLSTNQASGGCISTNDEFKANCETAGVRFIGVNGRLGYVVDSVKAPWRLSLLGGWYYSTMMVSGNAFGYTHLQGPQVFPVLKRTLNSKTSVFTYLKFSPIFGASIGLDNRELAAGLGYIHTMDSGNPLSINFDYANYGVDLSDTVNDVTTTVRATNVSYSLSLGYGL